LIEHFWREFFSSLHRIKIRFFVFLSKLFLIYLMLRNKHSGFALLRFLW
jgi:hypothetical protein